MNNYVIYRICFPNGKYYIGLTKDFKRRKKDHLANRLHKKCVIEHALSKYKNELQWEILHKDLSLERAKTLEQLEINQHNSYIKNKNSNGYNCTLGGEGTIGYNLSYETKVKLSNNKLFYVFNMVNGDKIGEWILRSKCAEDLNLSSSGVIGSCLRGTKPQYKGYTFVYAEEYIGQCMKYIKPNTWNKGIKANNELRKKLSLAQGGKKFAAYDKNTNKKVGEWINQRDCAEDLNINRKSITKALKGYLKSTHGYVFKYID